jgi:hypothetical protein
MGDRAGRATIDGTAKEIKEMRGNVGNMLSVWSSFPVFPLFPLRLRITQYVSRFTFHGLIAPRSHRGHQADAALATVAEEADAPGRAPL